MRTRSKLQAIAGTGAFALLTAGLVIASAPEDASAHGGLTYPATRTYACYVDGINGGNGGALNPQNPMCRALLENNGNYPFYNWFGNLLSDSDGRHREVIPDGELCGPGSQFSAVNTPGDWPTTQLESGANITFQYNAWAPHPGTWSQYITRDGWDPSQPLAWSDLELFDEVTDPPIRQGGPEGAEYYWNATLPQRSGQHIIYSIWTRSDSPEAFYNCSDVVFGGGGGTPTPTPTTPAPTPTPDPTTPAPTPTPEPTPTTPAPTPTTPPASGECTAELTVTSSWSDGYQADVTVTAGSSSISGWTTELNLSSGGSIQNLWNGSQSGTGSSVTVSNVGWNGSLGAGQTASYGFLGTGSAPSSVSCAAS
ncbi:chitin-binding protein [Cellulomonas bogoriensis 69B4 = DSM 16987]|uniref:Chitin-binding protein n=2 Tax=Cellulomonas bogoriensis TaxID=301388 RepID=A0A0A0BY38_9CELL|nr:chitin-binding protein [Cellulomonas bogoriensis 69B4 = DSM 16987]